MTNRIYTCLVDYDEQKCGYIVRREAITVRAKNLKNALKKCYNYSPDGTKSVKEIISIEPITIIDIE